MIGISIIINTNIEVILQNEDVWLNAQAIAELFDVNDKAIYKHIANIYEQEELEEDSTFSILETIGKNGHKYKTKYYNLDMIISVGYRVKSQEGIIFRKWATKILKDYMLKGYAVNQKRLEYLEKTVKLIDIANRMDERLENNDAKEILKVIGEYSKALDLLDDYDHKSLTKPKGKISNEKITYKNCIDIIKTLKFNEKSDIFALERDKGLESIINNIYQTFDGKDVYESVEEKSANFLYTCVKNHVFI